MFCQEQNVTLFGVTHKAVVSANGGLHGTTEYGGEGEDVDAANTIHGVTTERGPNSFGGTVFKYGN